MIRLVLPFGNRDNDNRSSGSRYIIHINQYIRYHIF